MKVFQKRFVAAAVMVLAIAAGILLGQARKPEGLGQASTAVVGTYTYVYDYAGVLTDKTMTYIDEMNTSLFAQTGAQIMVQTVDSTGGTDIVAMLMRKFTSLNIGNALMCSDLIITLMACVAFGMETGLFSILGLIIKSVMVDMVLENINTHKCFHIITAHPELVEPFITQTLHRGATELHGEGAYTHEGRTVLLTVVNRREAVLLRRHVKKVDPSAFLLITNTGEIIGKGFRGVT